MASDEPPRPGIFTSLRRICDLGLGLVQNRIELFAVELEEQKVRLVRVLVLVAAAVFLANTAILVITATIVIAAGEAARVPVLIGLCVFYVLAAVISGLMLRKEIRASPAPFEGSVSEIKKDRQWLKPPN